MRHLITLLLFVCGVASADEQRTLTVYTYNSFTADWGPGPAIEKAFESECQCDLVFVATDDGVALLSRVRLEGPSSKADIVLGLDTNLIAEAKKTGLFAQHGRDPDTLSVPGGWSDDVFLPYDYGYFAFVYDKTRLATPPTSMRTLIEGSTEKKILIQDPRTSTPGLGLLLWIRKIYGDDAGNAWRRLAPRILTVSKGWSESYGLFLDAEAPLVLSYTTSPAYHRIAESDDRFASARFDEGHYLQVEVAGKLTASPQPALADRFLAFMVTEKFQKHVPTGNWMYPVIELEAGLPEGFDALTIPSTALSFTPEEVASNRKAWVSEWLDALSR